MAYAIASFVIYFILLPYLIELSLEDTNFDPTFGIGFGADFNRNPNPTNPNTNFDTSPPVSFNQNFDTYTRPTNFNRNSRPTNFNSDLRSTNFNQNFDTDSRLQNFNQNFDPNLNANSRPANFNPNFNTGSRPTNFNQNFNTNSPPTNFNPNFGTGSRTTSSNQNFNGNANFDANSNPTTSFNSPINPNFGPNSKSDDDSLRNNSSEKSPKNEATFDHSNSHNCTINPCINGFCLDNQTSPLGYSCFCKDGYTGFQCQIRYDECKPDYCKNGATCVQEDSSLTCFCKNGYKGTYCEELIDNCSSMPCLNGGRCRNFENGYECICAKGFEGRNCEQDIDVCTLEKCANNGTCVEGLGYDYKCQCQFGYEGKNCEKVVDKCSPNPCENHGRCVSTRAGHYVCNCPCEYTGRHCENKVQFCKEKDFCLNNGMCVIIEDYLESNTSRPVRYEKNICYCKPSYYGDRCEFRYMKCLSSNTICENNGTCVDSKEPNESFSCLCNDRFKGKYCEIDCKLTGDCPVSQIEPTPSLNSATMTAISPSRPTDSLVFTSFGSDHQPKKTTIYFTNSLPSDVASSTFSDQTTTAVLPTDLIRPTESHLITPSFPQSTDEASSHSLQFNVTEQRKNPAAIPSFSPPITQRNRTSGQPNFDNQNPLNRPFYPFNNQNNPQTNQTSNKMSHIFSPRFNGLYMNTSFLQFEKDKHEFATSFMIHFDFSTDSSNGILFQTEAEFNPILFVVVYLENGLLKLSFSCNEQSTLYLISDKHHQLNNNQNNHVQMHFRLKKSACECQIQLNNSLSINKNQTSSVALTSKVCFKYFNFGNKQGDNPYLPQNIAPFRGCLKNIHINNNLKLVKDALRAEYLDECSLERICELSPCGKHGECSKTNNDSNGDAFHTYNTNNNLTNRIKRTIDQAINFFQNGLDLFGNPIGFNNNPNPKFDTFDQNRFSDQNGVNRNFDNQNQSSIARYMGRTMQALNPFNTNAFDQRQNNLLVSDAGCTIDPLMKALRADIQNMPSRAANLPQEVQPILQRMRDAAQRIVDVEDSNSPVPHRIVNAVRATQDYFSSVFHFISYEIPLKQAMPNTWDTLRKTTQSMVESPYGVSGSLRRCIPGMGLVGNAMAAIPNPMNLMRGMNPMNMG